MQHPDPRKLNATRKRLPKFKPHDLQPILNAARAVEGQSWSDHAVLEIRRRNQKQMADLLRRLGVDPSQPDAWQRGFFLLAFYHHGVGNLTWRIPRTNKDAATWTNAADLNLLREVTTLMAAAGISELQAIKRIILSWPIVHCIHRCNVRATFRFTINVVTIGGVGPKTWPRQSGQVAGQFSGTGCSMYLHIPTSRRALAWMTSIACPTRFSVLLCAPVGLQV